MNPLKTLAFYFDSYFSGLATSLSFIGNTLPIPAVTVPPQGTPPGNVGVQIYVDPGTHVVTFYVYDSGSATWIAK